MTSFIERSLELRRFMDLAKLKALEDPDIDSLLDILARITDHPDVKIRLQIITSENLIDPMMKVFDSIQKPFLYLRWLLGLHLLLINPGKDRSAATTEGKPLCVPDSLAHNSKIESSEHVSGQEVNSCFII
jgi:hypothetical protein